MQTIVFGGGCFWCTEAVFQMLRGVTKVEPGYAGGTSTTASYERVSEGNTGHAEVIRVSYDPSIISYVDLLTVFFGSHDPTTLNQQGNDVGAQYRSVIFYTTPDEKDIAEHYIEELQASLNDGARVVTEVVSLESVGGFFPAESYHRNYFKENTSAPYCQLIIEPKLEKVRKRFAELVNPVT